MALQRAFESARPERSRLFRDPLARDFLSTPLRVVAELARIPVLGPLVPRLYDLVWPGPRPSAVARTRLIDDSVCAAIRRGIRQVILLGAGFDSRAWRLPEMHNVRVFEVDQPDMQTVKVATLRQLRQLLDHVTFVPVDFEQDDLGSALRGTEMRGDEPSMFVWEGVTNYLTAVAVDRTLREVRAVAAPGTEVVFTYVHQGVLDGSVDFPEARRWVRSVAGVGEAWTFGLLPDRLRAYLATRGLQLMWDISTADAGRTYFEPLRRADQASQLYRVALARVPCPA
jgi:methyltransferase (TIGR00027 family)